MKHLRSWWIRLGEIQGYQRLAKRCKLQSVASNRRLFLLCSRRLQQKKRESNTSNKKEQKAMASLPFWLRNCVNGRNNFAVQCWRRIKWPRSRGGPKPGFPDKGYRGKREGGSCTTAEPRPGKERPYKT